MSSKPENTFRSSIHKHLPVELHHEKMNNPYSSGTADDWYSGMKADLWVEYKFLPRKPQRGNVWLCNPNVKQPPLSVLQQRWLRGRYEEGRNVHVVVGCPEGGVIMSVLSWEEPWSAEKFAQNLLDRKALARWIVSETMR